MHKYIYKHIGLYRHWYFPFHLAASDTLKHETKSLFLAWLFLPFSPEPAILPLEVFSNFQSFI